MGRTAKTATAEKLLPLPLQFLAAWIGMWLGELCLAKRSSAPPISRRCSHAGPRWVRHRAS